MTIIIGIDPPSLTARRPKRRYNESAPGRCVNTNRGLTPTVRRNRTEGSMKPTFLPLPTLTTADQDRFWAKVHAATADGCWIWQAGLDTNGYGKFSVGGRAGGQWGAHRLAWAMLRGDIPDGLEIDHLCQQRMCVNPWHMDPVTTAVNSRRSRSGEVNAARQRAKTHCPQGHAYDEANTYVNRRGARVCRECSRQQSARRYALNPAKYREIARQSRERRSS